MTNQRPEDVAAEAERYLAAIAIFRAEGREPRWRPEPASRPRRQPGTSTLDRVLSNPASRSHT
jgi:hypothetical protein